MMWKASSNHVTRAALLSSPQAKKVCWVRAALVGLPGAGRTTIFQALTRSRRCMAGFPGLERGRRGSFAQGSLQFEVADLPGIYGLSSQNPDERLVRDYLLERGETVVVQVADAPNLERHLYLTSHLLELGLNLVLCINRCTQARRQGWDLDFSLLGARLGGTRVVCVDGTRLPGIEALRAAIVEAADHPRTGTPYRHHPELEAAIGPVERLLSEPAPARAGDGDGDGDGGEEASPGAAAASPVRPGSARCLALALLQGDEELARRLRRTHPRAAQVLAAAAAQAGLAGQLRSEGIVEQIAAGRWSWASSLMQQITLSRPLGGRASFSDRLDRLLTHRLLGLPSYLLIIYGVFWLTFRLGEAPSGWIEAAFGELSRAIATSWPEQAQPALRSLLLNGILAGVGGVVTFLPYIVLLFFGLSLLQDSGYLARAAFLNDRLMRRMGLHGKSFVPMALGFGCNVPAVMACRLLENERDRLTTMMIIPLMSCGARLPVYLLLIPAFFPSPWWAPLMMGVYLFGVVMAALLARLLRATLLAGEDSPFVLELPAYRIPTGRALLGQALRPAWIYLREVGTVVLALSVVLWALTSHPHKPEFEVDLRAAAGEVLQPGQLEAERAAEQLRYSAAGRIGKAIEPILAPMGFDWRLGTAFLGALAAKEMFVAQMGIVSALGEVDESSPTLRQRLAEAYPPWVGLAVVLFTLVASPCMSTLAAVRRESGSWRWPLLQWFGLTLIAYLLATAINQIGALVA